MNVQVQGEGKGTTGKVPGNVNLNVNVHGDRCDRDRREQGFTLMEILIAMTILMIGLLPMMAVFQASLRNLNRAIEDTYAAAIAQSVMDSIRLGLKDMKVEHADGTKFFILDHDGSKDLENDRKTWLSDPNFDITSAANKARLLSRDYAVLLPLPTEQDAAPRGGMMGRAYLYPRKNPGTNRPGTLDYVKAKVTATDGSQVELRKVKVEKVYQLGKKLTDSTQEVEKYDTYPQYSFAFTIRPAKAPNPLTPKIELKDQAVLAGLYEVVVMVFRNFNPDPQNKKNDPVGGSGREFITYVAE